MKKVCKETRNRLSVANKLGVAANGYRVVDTSAEDPDEGLFDYPDSESEAIGAIADEYAALVSFGGGETSYDSTADTIADLARQFNDMMEQLRSAKTVADCDAIFGEFGSLGQMKSVREYAKLKANG